MARKTTVDILREVGVSFLSGTYVTSFDVQKAFDLPNTHYALNRLRYPNIDSRVFKIGHSVGENRYTMWTVNDIGDPELYNSGDRVSRLYIESPPFGDMISPHTRISAVQQYLLRKDKKQLQTMCTKDLEKFMVYYDVLRKSKDRDFCRVKEALLSIDINKVAGKWKHVGDM